jgi:hypothetical protein
VSGRGRGRGWGGGRSRGEGGELRRHVVVRARLVVGKVTAQLPAPRAARLSETHRSGGRSNAVTRPHRTAPPAKAKAHRERPFPASPAQAHTLPAAPRAASRVCRTLRISARRSSRPGARAASWQTGKSSAYGSISCAPRRRRAAQQTGSSTKAFVKRLTARRVATPHPATQSRSRVGRLLRGARLRERVHFVRQRLARLRGRALCQAPAAEARRRQAVEGCAAPSPLQSRQMHRMLSETGSRLGAARAHESTEHPGARVQLARGGRAHRGVGGGLDDAAGLDELVP